MRIEVEIKGDHELVRNLRKISKNATRKALSKAAKAGAEPIAKRMKELAPVDTGRLRDSIKTSFAYRSSNTARVRIGPRIKPKEGYGVAYDVFQEYGTSDHPAQPYARPAADEKKELAIEIVRSVMQGAVLEEVRKLGH